MRADLDHLKWMLIRQKGLSQKEANKRIALMLQTEKKDNDFNERIKKRKNRT